MEKHLIILGHGGIDSGAVGNGTNERDFLRGAFYSHLKHYAKESKIKNIGFYDTKNNAYKDRAMNVLNKNLVVTELHLDSSDALSMGGHVIIHKDLNPDALDMRFSDLVKRHFGLRPANRATGIDYRSDLLNLNVAKKRHINYRLVELCYISSKVNMNHFKANVETIAREIIEAITGENLKEKLITKHRVTYNDTLYKLAIDYNTTIDSIVKINHITNKNLIVVGQTLTIIKGDK